MLASFVGLPFSVLCQAVLCHEEKYGRIGGARKEKRNTKKGRPAQLNRLTRRQILMSVGESELSHTALEVQYS